AFEQARAVYGEPSRAQAIVLAGEGWPLGIVGIVAAKVTEETGRPALVLSLDHTPARGSGRSAGGVDLRRALEACKDRLITFGGHPQAVGLSIDPAQLEAFRADFGRAVKRQLAEKRAATALEGDGPDLAIDALVQLPEVRAELLRELARLEPFGAGNKA